MIGMLVETVVVAFVMGGIIGAITALHISNQNANDLKKVPIKLDKNKR